MLRNNHDQAVWHNIRFLLGTLSALYMRGGTCKESWYSSGVIAAGQSAGSE